MKIVRRDIKQSLLSLAAFALPVVFFFIIIWAFPRPYYMFFTDGEQTMYYGSKLFYYGFIPCDLRHPGMISYYVGALIMTMVGPDIHRTQLFLNLGYLFVALAMGIMMVYYSRRFLSRVPFGIGLLSLIVLFCYPPVLTWSDMISAESLIFLLAFLVLILFWPALESENPRQITLHYGLTGIALGVSLANHAVALILFSIVCLVGFIRVIPVRSPLWSRLLIFLLLPASAVFTYFVFSLPVHYFIYSIWASAFGQDAVHLSFERLLTGLQALTSGTSMLPETVTQLIVILIFLAILGVLIVRETRAKRRTGITSWMCQALLILSLFLAFLYTLSTSLPYGYAGVTVRYTLPFVGLFSFALVFIFERLGKENRIYRVVDISAIGISLLILLSSMIGFLQLRSNLIARVSEQVKASRDQFNSYNSAGGRIAFWDGSPGYLFGEASFHFWGNYAYGGDTFDNEVLAAFPEYAFFKLRQVRYLGNHLPPYSQADYSEPLPIWSRLKRLVFPLACIQRNGEIVTGEQQGVPISLVVFPVRQDYEFQGLPLSSLENLLVNRLGGGTLQEVSIDGVQWHIFSIKNPDQVP